ncbi:hypothetical protein ACBJ59_10995 [Nonomuraea sp. MTCD27]|uniref:hypothetical protein n=1 Tax=Nonomuraea sp. MTCD27 TaxID=1676747 RepID=UPI0035C09AA0
MSRAYYDQIAAEWRAAVEAVRASGGDAITIPVSPLVLILHGYEQLSKDREAGLAWITSAAESGYLDNTAAAHARHALGDLGDEQLAAEVRAASQHQEGQ